MYINLNTEIARKQFLEQNFAENKLAGWRLSRLEAVDGSMASREPIRGDLRANEKACFLSHMKAIGASLSSPGHLMIVEDDALFGKNSCKSIERAVASLPQSGWDLMFTDVCVTNIHSMIELFTMRRRLASNQQSAILDLKQVPFCGSTAYVVNGNSKEKVLDVLRKADPLDRPYDLYLRDRIRKSELHARVIFPFATSLSEFADSSSIQPDDESVTDMIWNAFRKLVWGERSIELVQHSLECIDPDYLDAETRVISKILAAQLSPRFRSK